MEKTTMKLTYKFRIVVELPTYEERKEAMDKLYRWRNRCYRAANLIVSHLYVQEMLKEFFYLTEGIQYKLADEKKDKAGMLTRSRINTTYRTLSNRFKGEVPMNILSCLNNALISSFRKDSEAYCKGERSIKNFKKTMAFPFGLEGIGGFCYNEEKRTFYFRLFSIPFRIYLGKGREEKTKMLKQVISGEIKMCSSHIKINDGKVFWLPVFEIKKEEHCLNPEVIAEASMSFEYPLIVKIGKARYTIGTQEEFLYRRLAIQASLERARVGADYCRSDKGIIRKLKATEKLKNAESNYVNNRLHVYSKRLIDLCVEHKAGTLILVDQQDKMEIAKAEEFVLRNWSYYNLMTKIKYKAEKAGIELIM